MKKTKTRKTTARRPKATKTRKSTRKKVTTRRKTATSSRAKTKKKPATSKARMKRTIESIKSSVKVLEKEIKK